LDAVDHLVEDLLGPLGAEEAGLSEPHEQIPQGGRFQDV